MGAPKGYAYSEWAVENGRREQQICQAEFAASERKATQQSLTSQLGEARFKGSA